MQRKSMRDEIILAKRSAKWKSDVLRRINILESKDYYYNNQMLYLKETVKDNYPSSYTDMYPFLDVINLTSTIIDQRSLLFEEAPEIKLIDVSDKIQSNFDKMLYGARMVPTLQKLNKYVNLTKKVGCMPHYDNGKVTLEIITADKVFVEQNEAMPTKANEIWVQIGVTENSPRSADKINTYLRWTAKEQQKIEINNSSGTIIKEYDPIPNPYKRIPIVWFTDDIEEDSFWFDQTNILVEKNLILNMDLSALRYGAALQSFSTLILEGFEGDEDIKMGVQRPIKIPASEGGDAKGSAYYISPGTKLTEIYDYIDRRTIHFINSLGISASSYRSDNSTYSSGYQLRLSKLDVIKKNIADRIYYTNPIKDLCILMMQCFTLHSTKQFPAGVDVAIDYHEMKFDENPKEKTEINIIKLNNNLTSVPRILKKDNPDLTLEAAKELAKEIADENKELNVNSIPEEGKDEV